MLDALGGGDPPRRFRLQPRPRPGWGGGLHPPSPAEGLSPGHPEGPNPDASVQPHSTTSPSPAPPAPARPPRSRPPRPSTRASSAAPSLTIAPHPCLGGCGMACLSRALMTSACASWLNGRSSSTRQPVRRAKRRRRPKRRQVRSSRQDPMSKNQRTGQLKGICWHGERGRQGRCRGVQPSWVRVSHAPSGWARLGVGDARALPGADGRPVASGARLHTRSPERNVILDGNIHGACSAPFRSTTTPSPARPPPAPPAQPHHSRPAATNTRASFGGRAPPSPPPRRARRPTLDRRSWAAAAW